LHPFLVKTEHVEALEEVRGLLRRLADLAREVEAADDAGADVAALLSHLDDLFLVVVVGEVKSGKSLLVNTLLRSEVCAVGPTPVTDRITILRHGGEERSVEREEWILERTVPTDRLRGLCIVDTPGTNSIVRRHDEITRAFLPQADLVLFVTSCDRPYSESENEFLHLIRERWRRKIVFVLSKTDIKEPEEVEEIVAYVRRCCREQLSLEPTVLPLAVKPARAALAAGREEDLPATGLPALEEYVHERLDDREKTRLRLFGAVDGGRSVLGRIRERIGDFTGRLERDYRILAELEEERVEKRRTLHRAHHMQLTRLGAVFTWLRERGERFMDSRLRLFRLPTPGARRRLEKAFRDEVIRDLDERLVGVLEEAVGWLEEETIRFYHYVLEVFTRKVWTDEDPRPGAVTPSRFEAEREEVLEGIRSATSEAIDGCDADRRSGEVLELARKGLGLSAAGLGAGVVTAGVATALVNLWWSVVALPFVAFGMIALGVMKGRALRAWTRQVSELDRRFQATLSAELTEGIDRTIDRVQGVYEPFLDFYREERERADEQDRRAGALDADLAAARDRIQEITAGE